MGSNGSNSGRSNSSSSPCNLMVEAAVHASDACVLLYRGFVYVYRQGDLGAASVYAQDALPVGDHGCVPQLGALVRQAKALLEHAMATIAHAKAEAILSSASYSSASSSSSASASASASSSSFFSTSSSASAAAAAAAAARRGASVTGVGRLSLPLFSAEVRHWTAIPGWGRFTSFADGRVQVTFDDRVLLSLDRDHEYCELILADGRNLAVRCLRPLGMERYVDMTIEFATWSFMTPGERAGVAAKAEERAERTRRELWKCRHHLELEMGGLFLDPREVTDARAYASLPVHFSAEDSRQKSPTKAARAASSGTPPSTPTKAIDAASPTTRHRRAASDSSEVCGSLPAAPKLTQMYQQQGASVGAKAAFVPVDMWSLERPGQMPGSLPWQSSPSAAAHHAGGARVRQHLGAAGHQGSTTSTDSRDELQDATPQQDAFQVDL